MSNKSVTNTDKIIGRKIRGYRVIGGLTLEELAGQLGITPQQLTKNETGTNRIVAGRLALIAEILKRPISDFFEEAEISAEDGNYGRQSVALMKGLNLLDTEYRVRILGLINSLPKRDV